MGPLGVLCQFWRNFRTKKKSGRKNRVEPAQPEFLKINFGIESAQSVFAPSKSDSLNPSSIQFGFSRLNPREWKEQKNGGGGGSIRSWAYQGRIQPPFPPTVSTLILVFTASN